MFSRIDGGDHFIKDPLEQTERERLCLIKSALQGLTAAVQSLLSLIWPFSSVALFSTPGASWKCKRVWELHSFW